MYVIYEDQNFREIIFRFYYFEYDMNESVNKILKSNDI